MHGGGRLNQWLQTWSVRIRLWLVANRGNAHVLAILAGTYGLVSVPFVGHELSKIPWDVGEDAPRVVSAEPEMGYVSARYPIVVNGLRYVCNGGETRAGSGPVEVVYDPKNPARCRTAMNAGAPSQNQLLQLLTGISGLAFAVAFFSWKSDFGTENAQTGARWSGRVFLGLLLILVVATICHRVEYGGP